MAAPSSKLFQPFKVGDITPQHHVVMAPLTRFRANDEHAHSQIGIEYYTQRASMPGTLIITEATEDPGILLWSWDDNSDTFAPFFSAMSHLNSEFFAIFRPQVWWPKTTFLGVCLMEKRTFHAEKY